MNTAGSFLDVSMYGDLKDGNSRRRNNALLFLRVAMLWSFGAQAPDVATMLGKSVTTVRPGYVGYWKKAILPTPPEDTLELFK